MLQGTFFLLEKLKLTVLRRLLMRCCILHLESCPPGTPNPHHFPLGKLGLMLLLAPEQILKCYPAWFMICKHHIFMDM